MTMRNVIRVEMRRETFEKVISSKVHQYARGGFSKIERIERREVERPVAVLSCGHARMDVGQKVDVTKAKRLMCWECQQREQT